MLSEREKEVVLALADNGMVVRRAARQLGMHYNTVHNRMEEIYSQTDLDPKDFYDLQQLVEMAIEQD